MRRISLIEKSYKQSLAAKPKGSVNSALEVAAVEFQDYQGQVLGVIVTPWFMGLMLLPLELEGWRDHQTGDSHKERLPAGDFEFVHGWDPKFGAYGSCPLFSPMDEFPDQTTAIQMAKRAMEQIFKDPQSKEVTKGEEVVEEKIQREVKGIKIQGEMNSADQIGETSKSAAADKAIATESTDFRSSHSKADSSGAESVDMRRRGLFTGSLFRRK